MPMVRSSGRVVGWAMMTRTVLRLRYGMFVCIFCHYVEGLSANQKAVF